MSETRRVEITDRDVDFVRTAMEHYRLFAETMESRPNRTRDEERSLGVFRAQEFYAERFLARIEDPSHA